MATGIVISVAGKLYDVLHSEELKEMYSMFGYKSQLDGLKTTVLTIKSVLLDAETKHQGLTNEGRDYIERLKDAVYDVDDLLDEFNTMVQKEKNKMGGKISKKVRRFFSRTNQIGVAYNMSHEIKSLRRKLDKIAKDRQQFGLSDVYVPVKRREETMSFASEDKIIGRETEKEAIVGMLLADSKSSNDVEFVTVVGMGGLGKTALAQLVFNDPRIENAFEMRLWVCVSDDFSLDKIFQQVLGGINQESNIEQLQREFRKLIQGERYLLVLDDVWNENRHEWDDLKWFLKVGGKGSRVVVTSRSKKVASVVGNDLIYELQGLTDDFSWNLFKRLAFKQGKEPMNSNDCLFDVGKEIVKKCANVPLLIKVVGSMLYDQDDSLWQSLKSSNLLETTEHQCSVMPVLKYSYYHLTPALKNCFSYCALFPKDFTIEKRFLVRLWLAQGCLGNSHDCRSEEDVGEKYFSILLHRCFFQDIVKDKYGEIEYCKMHDLIHDLALEVAGTETIILDSHKNQFDKRSRHLSFTANGVYLLRSHSTQLSEMKSLRTFFPSYGKLIEFHSLFASKGTAICQHLTRLRVLSFRGCGCETLPDTLGNLLQLRYLDLSKNWRLKVLPNSITKLINLLVLNLDDTHVRELPRDMRKLVNLRHLCLRWCNYLTHMPPGLDTLTNLHTLSTFVLGDETSNQGQIGKLRDLKALVNLRYELTIKVPVNFRCDVAEYDEVELLKMAPLKHLNIDFNDQGAANHETLLGCLQPHCMLSALSICNYKGLKLPLWAESLTSSLPHLVSIHLEDFHCSDTLSLLSQLHHLKYLEYLSLRISNVESVENDGVVITVDRKLLFFPSLKELELNNLPKLKGWLNEETSKLVTGESCASSLLVPSFPCLRKLVLRDCPDLTVFPSCPKLISVELKDCHEALTLFESRTVVPCNATTRPTLYLKELTIDNVGGIDCLFGDLLGGIRRLSIQHFNGETLSNSIAAVRIAASIEKLSILSCNNLKSVSGVVEHFTNLQSLEIKWCKNLELATVAPWKAWISLSFLRLLELPKLLNLPNEFKYLTSLQYLTISSCDNLELATVAPWKAWISLSFLVLEDLPKLLNLPNELKYLTSLQQLFIAYCENFEALPEWLSCLTSLQSLSIHWCPKLKSLPEAIAHMPSLNTFRLSGPGDDVLKKRCRKPDGEDWPKICHIPDVFIY